MNDDRIKELLEQLARMKKDLEDFQKKALLNDGKILKDEQDRIDRMMANIKLSQEVLDKLLEERRNSPSGKVRQWMLDNWGDGLSLQAAIQGVRKINLTFNDGALAEIYKEVQQIMANAPQEKPEDKEPSKVKKVVEKAVKFTKLKYQFNDLKIQADIPSLSLKTEFGFPENIIDVDVIVKANLQGKSMLSFKFGGQRQFEFSMEYNDGKKELTTGILFSNAKGIAGSITPEQLSTTLAQQGQEFANALQLLSQNPNDKDARKEASKRLKYLRTSMKDIKRDYAKKVNVQTGLGLLTPLGKKEGGQVGFFVRLLFH